MLVSSKTQWSIENIFIQMLNTISSTIKLANQSGQILKGGGIRQDPIKLMCICVLTNIKDLQNILLAIYIWI